mmetsp:Transcript_17545/g.48441  ORF Transcript_17545/g.48441 Transcript_17545/m.48441 type:complete len:98 (+) Transcript_17545:109-402(+)
MDWFGFKTLASLWGLAETNPTQAAGIANGAMDAAFAGLSQLGVDTHDEDVAWRRERGMEYYDRDGNRYRDTEDGTICVYERDTTPDDDYCPYMYGID